MKKKVITIKSNIQVAAIIVSCFSINTLADTKVIHAGSCCRYPVSQA